MASRMHLYARQADVVNQVNGVKNTFSSWDGCMAKSYCKWPVIAAIVVVSLIVISIIWGCARCLCCGLECCCGCLRCCNACCPSPRGGSKGHRNLEPPPRPYGGPAEQYQGHTMPRYNNPAAPQFAQFDVAKPMTKQDEDKLPAMPSWETAVSKKVEVEEAPPQAGVEMDDLKKKEELNPMLPNGSRQGSPAPSPNGYPGARNSPGPGGRGSPYSQSNGPDNYFAGAVGPGGPGRSPNRSPGPGYGPPGSYRGNGSPGPGQRPFGPGGPNGPNGPGGYRGPPSGPEGGMYGPPPGSRGSPSPRPGYPGPRGSPGPYSNNQMPSPGAYGGQGYGPPQRSPNGPQRSPLGPGHSPNGYNQSGADTYAYPPADAGYAQPRPQDRSYNQPQSYVQDHAYSQDQYGHDQGFRAELDAGAQNYAQQQPPPSQRFYGGQGGGHNNNGTWRDV